MRPSSLPHAMIRHAGNLIPSAQVLAGKANWAVMRWRSSTCMNRLMLSDRKYSPFGLDRNGGSYLKSSRFAIARSPVLTNTVLIREALWEAIASSWDYCVIFSRHLWTVFLFKACRQVRESPAVANSPIMEWNCPSPKQYLWLITGRWTSEGVLIMWTYGSFP